jgi:hypothetical protein
MFARRIIDEVVQAGMIEHVQDLPVHGGPDRVEVLYHAPSRSFCLQRAANRNFKTVGMPVEAGTFALVIRENVRCLEPEVLTNLHISPLRGMRTLDPSL